MTTALGREWPSYAAYLVSFLVIGIIWINHHSMFGLVRRVDRPVLFANLALLLVVSVLPFPTRLLADSLTAPEGSHVAAAVYSANMVAMSVVPAAPRQETLLAAVPQTVAVPRAGRSGRVRRPGDEGAGTAIMALQRGGRGEV